VTVNSGVVTATGNGGALTIYGGKVIFTQEKREITSTTLHRFNLFKRLESSVYAFGETIGRLIDRTNKAIAQLENIGSDTTLEVDALDDDDDFLDYKYEININHLNAAEFLLELYYDKEILDELIYDIRRVLNEKRDLKLEILRGFLRKKIAETPYNDANRKVLIFSAFSDTAEYLYAGLQEELKALGVYTGFVSGSKPARSNNGGALPQEYSMLLRAFSPVSKKRRKLSPAWN
jgi:ERCC4-related helicase